MKRFLQILLAVFVCLGVFYCAGNRQSTKGTSNDSTDTIPPVELRKTNWEYSTTTEEMDDSKTYIARIEATEELKFSAPYNGGTKVWLLLRKNGVNTNVILSISKNKGQFLPNILNDQRVNVRFDDQVAEKYSYENPADYSVETIFLNNTVKFIKNIKAAKQTIVQCAFYQEGIQTIKFDTEGLDWSIENNQ